MKLFMKRVLLGIIIFSVFASASIAQTLSFTSGQWRTFTIEEGGSKTCYIASIPTSSSGTFKKRAEPFAMVTHRGTSDEVSFSSGYPYKQANDVQLLIDGKATGLFADNDRSWAKDAATDQALVASMMRGTNMNVKGESRLGSNSNDVYSLSGFTAAYNKMKELCK
jgi:hypothetical protein